MLEELLALRVEAENELLYAKAKIEVVDKLMSKFQSTVEVATVVDEPTEAEEAEEYGTEGI